MSSDESTLPVPDSSMPEDKFAFRSDQTSEAKAESAIEQTIPWIPGYRLLGPLGEGAFGLVYHAQQLSTGNEVAIKMLKKMSDRAKEEMNNEIRIISQLKNPYLVSVWDAGITSDERPYFVMDFVNGDHLTEYVKRTHCSLKRILEIFVKICQAVGYAHRKGVVHRDLKPSNIMITPDGDPMVLDFGLARVGAAPPVGGPTLREIGGTVDYMSPEATRGNRQEIDARSDVYSLGVILYQLLTGRLPYELVGGGEDKYRTIQEAVPIKPHSAWTPVVGVTKVTDHDTELGCPIDSDLERLVLKSLSKKREDRFENGAAFAAAIGRYMRGEPDDEVSSSFGLVLTGRIRGLVGQHPVVAMVLNLGFALFVSESLVTYMFFEKTGLAGHYDAMLAQYCTIPIPAPFERMALVRRPTPAEFSSYLSFLDGASPETPMIGRRLDGRFMQRLAEAGCRCTVVWDAWYRSDSEFDLDFVNGVKAIQKNGGAVVVAANSWWFDEPPSGNDSDLISNHPNLRVGCYWLSNQRGLQWLIPLVVQRGIREPKPSLAIAAIAAYQHPNDYVEFHLNTDEAILTLSFFKTHPDQPERRIPVSTPCLIRLDRTQPFSENLSGQGDSGLKEGDWIGNYTPSIPDDSAIASATIPFESAISDTSKMMSRFNDKIVFVGPLDSEIWPYVDGRQMSRALGHASAIDALMRASPTSRALPRLEEWLLSGAGVIFGCLFAVFFHGRLLRICACLITVVIGAVGVSVAWYWFAYVVWNPIVAVAAMLLAVLGGTAIMKRTRRLA